MDDVQSALPATVRSVTKLIERVLRFGRELTIGLFTFRWLRISRHDLRHLFDKKRLVSTGRFDVDLERHRNPHQCEVESGRPAGSPAEVNPPKRLADKYRDWLEVNSASENRRISLQSALFEAGPERGQLTDGFAVQGAIETPCENAMIAKPPADRRQLRYQRVASRQNANVNQAGSAFERILFQVFVAMKPSPSSKYGRTVESILAQTHNAWELTLVYPDGMTCEEATAAESLRDSRLKVCCDISLEAAIAREVATDKAPWIVVVEDGDQMDPNALLEYAAWSVQHPAYEIIFSDHDIIDAQGERDHPTFYPGWSPELLLSGIYPDGLIAMRSHLLKQLGAPDSSPGMLAKFDLMLRATELTDHVGHIPRILLHRSQQEASHRLDSKQVNVGVALLQSALDRRGIVGKAVYPSWARDNGRMAFSISFPDEGPSVAVLIATKNGLSVLRRCLQALAKTTYQNFQIYLIDNESDDPEMLRFLNGCGHDVLRIGSPNGRFSDSFINNEASRRVQEDYLLFLDKDTEVIEPNWLSQMVGWLGIAGVGSVGARLVHGNGSIQHAGLTNSLQDGVLPTSAFKRMRVADLGYLDLIQRPRNCSAVTAACMLTPRWLFIERGGFDETAFPVAYNDCDYGFRLVREGYRNVYCPEALLYHHGATTPGAGGDPVSPREEAAYVRKYGRWKDPYFNANFSRDSPDFRLSARTVVTGQPPKIRVAMLTHNLNYEGAPLVLWEIAKGFKNRRVAEPIVVSPLEGPLRHAYESHHIEVHVLPKFRILGAHNTRTYDRHLKVLANKLQGLGTEVTVSNTVLSWWGVDASNMCDTPSLWIIHESEEPFSHFDIHPPYVKNRARASLAAPYQVVFVADATRRVYEPLNTSNNFTVIHNGFDPARLTEQVRSTTRDTVRRELGLRPKEVCVLLPGTVCERKRQIDLVDAVSRLDSSSLRRTQFYIVGDRPSSYSMRLHQMLGRLPADQRSHVHVVGETGEIGKYFLAADILALTTGMESFPKVIQEAMHFALPIITTPVFGIREQVRDGTSALFFEPGDIQKLCEHLRLLIHSTDERIRLGANANISLAKLPDYEEMVDDYTALLREAWMSGRSRRRAA